MAPGQEAFDHLRWPAHRHGTAHPADYSRECEIYADPHVLQAVANSFVLKVDEVLVANDDATIRAMKLVWERTSISQSDTSAGHPDSFFCSSN